jgi:hypothetical protein
LINAIRSGNPLTEENGLSTLFIKLTPEASLDGEMESNKLRHSESIGVKYDQRNRNLTKQMRGLPATTSYAAG